MPRSAATVIENNFSKGLITEATGLNYPENSCVETWDCVFDFYGRVQRRLGFAVEPGFTSLSTSKTGLAITYYVWRNVTGDGNVTLVVVQIGSTLYFYNTAASTALSGGLLASTVNIASFSPVGAPSPSIHDCQYADGQGKLFVFHPDLDNFYVTYDSATEVLTPTGYEITIRDFEGAELDPYDIDERPALTVGTTDVNHLYNLFNQGWVKPDNTTPELTAWDAARTDIPSNCDQWWMFKNATEVFDTTWIDRNGRGSSPAPRGHYIVNLYDIDRDAVSGLSSVPSTTSGVARTSVGAFHAGRVFYAGVNSPGYTGKIYFTQILERDTQVGQCYQVADPTSEDLFDLLPADGGVISLPEAGTVYKLFSFGNGLLVFAYHGIWFITGSQGIGFTALDYTVSKISSIRTVSGTSFVDVNGVPMWWNTDGIWSVQANQNGGPQVQSLTIDTIQTFFDDIPTLSKVYARGYFNPLEQTVQWLYSSESPSTVEAQHSYDRVLNLNTYTKAFYPWTINDASGFDIKVHGLIIVDGLGGLPQETLVVDNSAVQVVDILGDEVVAYQLSLQGTVPKNKYLISFFNTANAFTWAETNDTLYVDFNTVHYNSYFITGYKVHGQAMMKFNPMYVTIYNEGIGQAQLQGVWDYAIDTASGRFSTKQFCDWSDDAYSVTAKRKKIRGHGRALQYKVSSVNFQPFNIIGWAALETGNKSP
jgi:hypothetical protein